MTSFYYYKSKIKSYPLYPYLQYLEIKKNISSFKVDTIEGYLENNKGTYWDTLLRPLWLDYLAENKMWKVYAKNYYRGNSLDQQCWYLRAKYVTNHQELALQKFTKIWNTGRNLPKSCDFLINKWSNSKYNTISIRWSRIILAMHSGNTSLAIYLSSGLNEDSQSFLKSWINTDNNPKKYLSTFIKQYKKHEDIDAAVLDIMKAYIRRSITNSIILWNSLAIKSELPASSQAKVNSYIAITLARKYNINAFKWFKKVPITLSSPLLWEWKARLAIRFSRWSYLLDVIENMPARIKQKNEWQYWLARANLKVGNQKIANIILNKLSKQSSFYGYLASDQLGINYNLAEGIKRAKKNILLQIKKDDTLKQVQELDNIGEYNLAYKLWRYTVVKYSKQERLAAAEIASKWGFFDMSLYAYALSGDGKKNLSDYYPLAYKEDVLFYSTKYDINPAWVWSLMRQESTFNIHARSYAGAVGLMQLMPATANFIANRYKIPYQGEKSLVDPKININIGIAHLSFVSQLFKNNIALATASYNAGQGNVAKWLPKYEVMESINWMETVPFLETRKYLRNILSNIVIYEVVQMKNKSFHLSSILKKIRPKN